MSFSVGWRADLTQHDIAAFTADCAMTAPRGHDLVPERMVGLMALALVPVLWRVGLAGIGVPQLCFTEWLPPPHVLHPWPEDRLAVKHPR
jgi:hypothetical protein